MNKWGGTTSNRSHTLTVFPVDQRPALNVRPGPGGKEGTMRPRRPRTRYKLKPVPVQDFMDRNNLTQKQMAERL